MIPPCTVLGENNHAVTYVIGLADKKAKQKTKQNKTKSIDYYTIILFD